MEGSVRARAASSEFGARLKQFREARRLSVDELAALLQISGNYVYTMERGLHAAALSVQERFEELSASADLFAVSRCTGTVRERLIPVVSWAQAGQATVYEELPSDWQDLIPSCCPDQQAYGIRLVGDSMEPKYHQGDVIVAMPNCTPKHDCLVLAKLAACEGVLFKRFTTCKTRPHGFKLVSFNRRYRPVPLTWDKVQWVYPIYCATSKITRYRQ